MQRPKNAIYILVAAALLLSAASLTLSISNLAAIRNSREENSVSSNIGGMLYSASQRTEYSDFTGKWFGEGNGNISFGISAGILDPGAEVSVSLMTMSTSGTALGRDIRFQLTERDREDGLLGIIEEETVYVDAITDASYREYFSASLPDKEGAYYMLSVEILDGNNQAEDTVVTKIHVPETNL